MNARFAIPVLLAAGLLAGAPSATAGDSPKFEDAERMLGSGEWKDRIQGLEMLEGFPGESRAEKAAMKALKDPDWEVVIRASRALSKVAKDGGRDALIRLAIEGEIQWVRDAAVGALREKDADDAQARLLAAAKSAVREPVQQARALDAAGVLGGAAALRTMEAFVVHKDAAVAAAAVRATGRIGAAAEKSREPAVDLLKRVLVGCRSERKHFHAYAAAVEALGRIPTAESTAALLDEMARLPDEDPYIPERAARGLRERGREGVGAAFAEAAGKAKAPAVLRRFARLAARAGLADARPVVAGWLAHADERVRSESIRALGLLGDPADAAALRPLLEDKSPFVRREVVTALARLLPLDGLRALATTLAKDKDEEVRLQFVVEIADRADPAALPSTLEFFADPSWRVASAAIATYGALGIASDLEPLIAPSGHKDWRIRAAAFEGMGRLRAKEAIPRLADALKDRDPVVRGVCLANLQILSREKFGPDAAAWQEWWTKHGAALDIFKRSRRDAATREKERKEDERYGNLRKYGIEVLQRARILVVEGAWDKVQIVLKHLQIPHTLLRAQQLKDAGLNPNQVVLVNCEGNLDEDSVQRLQWMVNTGGYVMATDWALAKAVRACFPGYADQFAGANTGNDVVVVEDAMPGHPFTAGVFENVPALKWWLEIQAFPIKVLYPERVDVLVDSAEMRLRYGSSSMALHFRWGLGRVQHSLSHFYLQEEGMQ
ncbi:MAG TPA: HEAT repeat domain-containing protein, partial [Planctomycetota bacterium]|nr:HEAT repeat domain-containing protein [Planctomycetota bacterium]